MCPGQRVWHKFVIHLHIHYTVPKKAELSRNWRYYFWCKRIIYGQREFGVAIIIIFMIECHFHHKSITLSLLSWSWWSLCAIVDIRLWGFILAWSRFIMLMMIRCVESISMECSEGETLAQVGLNSAQRGFEILKKQHMSRYNWYKWPDVQDQKRTTPLECQCQGPGNTSQSGLPF